MYVEGVCVEGMYMLKCVCVCLWSVYVGGVCGRCVDVSVRVGDV